jgi:hypothetical protein
MRIRRVCLGAAGGGGGGGTRNAVEAAVVSEVCKVRWWGANSADGLCTHLCLTPTTGAPTRHSHQLISCPPLLQSIYIVTHLFDGSGEVRNSAGIRAQALHHPALQLHSQLPAACRCQLLNQPRHLPPPPPSLGALECATGCMLRCRVPSTSRRCSAAKVRKAVLCCDMAPSSLRAWAPTPPGMSSSRSPPGYASTAASSYMAECMLSGGPVCMCSTSGRNLATHCQGGSPRRISGVMCAGTLIMMIAGCVRRTKPMQLAHTATACMEALRAGARRVRMPPGGAAGGSPHPRACSPPRPQRRCASPR